MRLLGGSELLGQPYKLVAALFSDDGAGCQETPDCRCYPSYCSTPTTLSPLDHCGRCRVVCVVDTDTLWLQPFRNGPLQRTGVYLLTLTRAEATQGGGLSIEIVLDLEGVVTSLVTR